MRGRGAAELARTPLDTSRESPREHTVTLRRRGQLYSQRCEPPTVHVSIAGQPRHRSHTFPPGVHSSLGHDQVTYRHHRDARSQRRPDGTRCSRRAARLLLLRLPIAGPCGVTASPHSRARPWETMSSRWWCGPETARSTGIHPGRPGATIRHPRLSFAVTCSSRQSAAQRDDYGCGPIGRLHRPRAEYPCWIPSAVLTPNSSAHDAQPSAGQYSVQLGALRETAVSRNPIPEQ